MNRLKAFIHTEQSGGIILLTCAIVSLVLANSAAADWFHHLLYTPVGFRLGDYAMSWPFEKWVNDGLMAIFFLVVGLEIKRELLEGHLSSFKQAIMPIIAAVGGMCVPATIYSLMGQSADSASGWGVPMATDIAFSLAILSLLGKRVPIALKVFLTALAIADDLGAVVVIALFYTSGVQLIYLGWMAALVVLMLLCNRYRVGGGWLYLIGGVALWYVTYKSGVHATIAGVLLALCVPFRSEYTQAELEEMLSDRRQDLEREIAAGTLSSAGMRTEMQEFAHNLQSMSHRIIADLHVAVSFLIMPLFALCNTAVHIDGSLLGQLAAAPSLGIIFGLLLGKPIGIVLSSWLAVRFGLGKMPERSTWPTMIGVGLLAGIGFTMSFFVSMLAFPSHPELQDLAKIAILIGSGVAGLAGFIWLSVTLKPAAAPSNDSILEDE